MKIKFGIARRCINPQCPISLEGYFNKRMWNKVLDDLEVRVLVMKDASGNYCAIMHFDLIFVTFDMRRMIIDGIKKAGLSKFSERNVITSATHTHTAPEVNLSKPGPSAEYIPVVIESAIQALKEAYDHMTDDGEVETAIAADNRFIFNRRYWMKDGTVLTNPGKLNPGIVRPEGEIDPEIPLCALKVNGKIKVLIANIVNHTDTIGGCGVSADWPGFLRRELEPEFAPGAMVIPLVGAEGNINHFDTRTDMDQTCYAESERIGKGYAETIRRALPTLKKVIGDGIKTAFAEVAVGTREIPPDEVREAQEIFDRYPEVELEGKGAEVDLTSEDLARETPFALKFFARKLLDYAQNRERQVFQLNGLRLGDSLVIATLPGEPFVEIGLTVRKGIFAGRLCMVAAMAGTGSSTYWSGYIPNAWNYGRGGYEITPNCNPYSTKTSEILVAAWKQLADKL